MVEFVLVEDLKYSHLAYQLFKTKNGKIVKRSHWCKTIQIAIKALNTTTEARPLSVYLNFIDAETKILLKSSTLPTKATHPELFI